MIENPLLQATAELHRRGLFTDQNAEHLAEVVLDKKEQALLRIWAVNILTQYESLNPRLSKTVYAEGIRLLSRFRRLPKSNKQLIDQLSRDLKKIAVHFQEALNNSISNEITTPPIQ